MKKLTKMVLVPLFLALAVSMSACDRSDWVSDETSTSHEVEGASEADTGADESGGMGVTYGGKIGYDSGGGMVTPITGGLPELGIGF